MSQAAADLLRELLDGVGSLHHELVSDLVGADDVVRLYQVAGMIDAAITTAVDRFAADTDFRSLGYPNAGAWLRAATGTWQGDAAGRISRAAVLRALPVFESAACSGRVGSAQVRLLCGAVTKARLPIAQRDETVLLEQAVRLDASQYAIVMRAWAAYCDDLLNDPSGEKAIEEKRSVRFHQLPDGSWKLDGVLDTECGEALSAAFDAFMPKTPLPDDTRSIPQRRHDTLCDLLHDALARPDRPDIGGERPHVTLNIDAATGHAFTSTGSPVPGWLRSTVMCDATLARVWFGADNVPFTVGTPTSDIPRRNRLAVLARDCHCRYPGCNRAARWCDVHHVRERENQGTHEISNLLLLCRFHHRLIHRLAIKLTLDADGVTILFEWPLGVILRSPPPTTLFGTRI